MDVALGVCEADDHDIYSEILKAMEKVDIVSRNYPRRGYLFPQGTP
jgi:hypothetical protein